MSGQWVLSVSQLNEYVRKSLAGDPVLRAVRVRGEITGFKRHYSGHLYFSVKDEQCRVQCVMFRQNAQSLVFEPADGMRVILSGQASLYPATGGFQIYCEGIKREGEGELYAKFEALKKKLSDEGLFDPARKRSTPFLPKCVGVVTSRTGAAFRDIIRVISRRCPGTKIVLCHASVQGQAAVGEIVSALDKLNARSDAEVILCGRGGGSIEELWAFNDEKVARAIARSRIPVISCVGHETDFTIADFVSDVRAATPSVAAEIAVPVLDDVISSLNALNDRLFRAQAGRMELCRARLRACASALGAPEKILIAPRKARLAAVSDRLYAVERSRIDKASGDLKAAQGRITALDPYQVLKRGYAVLSKERGNIKSALELKTGMKIDIRLCDGSAVAVIEKVDLEAEDGVKEEA